MSNSSNKNIFQRLTDYFSYKPKIDMRFVLSEYPNKEQDNHIQQKKEQPKKENKTENNKKKPLKFSDLKNNNNDNESQTNSSDKIYSKLEDNLQIIKKELNYPQNNGIIVRQFTIANEAKTKAFCVYIDETTDSKTLQNLLQSLMFPENFIRKQKDSICEIIPEEIIRIGELEQKYKMSEAVKSIEIGQAVLFIDGCNFAINIETKTFTSRGVDKPANESNILGPKEAFVESIKPNISMLRRIIKNKNFVIEKFPIGEVNHNTCFVMYIKDIANPSLVEEVKRRVSSIEIDFISSIGILEQCIEDNPYSIFPLVLTTERPDRVCAGLTEGRVSLMIDNCPCALIVPATITSNIQTSDDSNSRFIFSSFIRIFRSFAIILALLLPAIYIALVNYHQDMIPTDLLISIERAREDVPFPSIIEILLLEMLFEIIREASIRVPGLVGTTIGIVGALILGEAAVSAKLVSPILVVIIAATGIGSFAIPNYELGAGVRILRFLFTFLAFMFGFYGISLGLFVIVGILCGEKSFGVPIFTPHAPFTKNPIRDTFLRYPIWDQNTRPDYLQPLKKRKMPETLRKWDNSNE